MREQDTIIDLKNMMLILNCTRKLRKILEIFEKIIFFRYNHIFMA